MNVNIVETAMDRAKRKKRRVNVTLPEFYLEEVKAKGLSNLSALLSDLLGDSLAENKITITVSEETKHLYEQVIANTEFEDADVERHLRPVLETLMDQKLGEKIAELEALRQKLGRH